MINIETPGGGESYWVKTGNNLTLDLFTNSSQVIITQTATSGTEWVSGNPTGLIWINDDRAGATVSEKEEATVVIYAAGSYGLYVNQFAYITGGIIVPTGVGIFWTSTNSNKLVADNGWDQTLLRVVDEYGTQLVIGYTDSDYDHANQANPTLFIHSATDPDTNNTQWISICHNTSTGLISSGFGGITLSDTNFYLPTFPSGVLHVTSGTGIVSSTLIADSDVITNSDLLIQTLAFVVNESGSAITVGLKGFLPVHYNCSIISGEWFANTHGNLSVDIWKDTTANFPPADADSISSSSPIFATASNYAIINTPTNWVTAISAGDVLGFNIDSCTAIESATIALKVRKT